MSKIKVPKIQHYVPQFILRNFCIGKTAQLYVFDKSNGSVFQSNIKNVAAENGFYDLSIKDITATLELSLSDLEGKSSIILNKIIEDGSLINISDRERKILSNFFATQLIRVPRIRENYKQINDLFISILTKMGANPENHPQIIKNVEEFKVISLVRMGEMISELAPYFYLKDWILFKAPKNTPFCLSDNPVTLQNFIDLSPIGNLGLAVKGIEIYFPISSLYSLGMICKSYKELLDDNFAKIEFLKKLGFDPNLDISPERIENMKRYKICMESGIAFKSTRANVINTNSLQVIYSSRFIFSNNDDFSLAKEMIKIHPEFRQSPKLTHN